MSKKLKFIHLILIGGILLLINCAPKTIQRQSTNSAQDIEQLKAKLRANPNDVETMSQLGIYYFDVNQFSTARKYLFNAFKRNPKNSKVILYLGMTLENENQDRLAYKTYKRYQKLPQSAEFRSYIEAKFQLLSRKMIRENMKARIAKESQLSVSQLSPDAIAVFPLTFQGMNQEFASLGKGISEMIITDLSQVPELTLIERVQLQALLDEISLSQTGVIDEGSAPRFGKLVSAGKVVHGMYNVESNSSLKLDVAFWDVVNQEYPDFTSKEDQLNNLFYLEKDLVFNVIDDMGIELTQMQRGKIQRIPTKNMQAFLAYCVGLEMEDAGDFEAAVQYYEKAVKLDPNFKIASRKALLSQSLAIMNSKKPELLAANRGISRKKRGTSGLPPTIAPGGGVDLITSRLLNLSVNIGSTFVPGQDSRKPLEDVVNSDEYMLYYIIEGHDSHNLPDLPEPPDVPTRQ